MLSMAACREAVGRAPLRGGGHDEAVRQLALDVELDELRAAVVRLQAENERLLRLRLRPQEAAVPGPAQSGMFERPPGPVHARSDPAAKVAFFRAMFACRQDVYAARWQNVRNGGGGMGAGGSWWLADRAAAVTTGSKVDRLGRSTASRIHPPAPPFIPGRLGTGLALDRTTLPAALLATLKHAASMPNPVFYERERRRMSTYNLPRFLRC